MSVSMFSAKAILRLKPLDSNMLFSPLIFTPWYNDVQITSYPCLAAKSLIASTDPPLVRLAVTITSTSIVSPHVITYKALSTTLL